MTNPEVRVAWAQIGEHAFDRVRYEHNLEFEPLRLVQRRNYDAVLGRSLVGEQRLGFEVLVVDKVPVIEECRCRITLVPPAEDLTKRRPGGPLRPPAWVGHKSLDGWQIGPNVPQAVRCGHVRCPASLGEKCSQGLSVRIPLGNDSCNRDAGTSCDSLNLSDFSDRRLDHRTRKDAPDRAETLDAPVGGGG
ncbi:hypothetical protein BMS3Bbin02_01806 [bacterium BMS3Bbin02]|nr:hypothetical protein BMS3Bbin02_01806 [bacterium BMS3Bbin02]